MEINEIIKRERIKQGITQRELAENALQISQAQYQKYEIGKNEIPAYRIKLICKYLNISADYVLGLTEERKELY